MFKLTKAVQCFVATIFVATIAAKAQAAPELFVELGHSARVSNAAWSPDGTILATGDASGEVRLHDGKSGAWRSTFGANASVGALAFSPDGRTLAVGGGDGKVRLWRVPQSDETPSAPQVLEFGEGKVNYRSGDKYVLVDAYSGDEAVVELAWSSDGKLLAASGYRGHRSDTKKEARVRVWKIGGENGDNNAGGDNAGGESLWTRVIEADAASPQALVPLVAFDGDALVAAQAPNQLLRWNAQSGEPGETVELSEETVRGANASLAFSQGGARVLTRGKGDIKIYDTKSGQAGTTLQIEVAPESAEMIERRRKMAAEITGRRMPSRPPATGLARLGGVLQTAWSKDGKTVAALFGGGRWLVWDASSGKQTQMVVPRGEKLSSLALSPDAGILAAGDEAGQVRAWNIADGETKFFARGNLNPISFVDFARDEKTPFIVVGHESGIVALWNARDGKFARALEMPEDAAPNGKTLERDLTQLVASPDGKLLATAGYLKNYTYTMKKEGVPRGEVRVTDLISGRVLWKRTDATFGKVRDLQFWPDGKTLVVAMGGRPGRVRRGLEEGEGFGPLEWVDAKTGETRDTPLDFEGGVSSSIEGFAFSPDLAKIAISDRNRLRVWDIKTGKLILKPSVNGYNSPRLKFSPDNRWLAVAEASGLGRSRIVLWDTNKERGENVFSAEASLVGHDAPVQALEFSRDGHTLWSADRSGTLAAWDMTAPPGKDTKPLQLWPGNGAGILNLKLLPAQPGQNATLAAATADGKIRLWDVADPKNVKALATLQLIVPPVPVVAIGQPAPPLVPLEWIAYTPAGFYEASPGARAFLFAREDGKILPAAQVEKDLHRPDLVEKALRGVD